MNRRFLLIPLILLSTGCMPRLCSYAPGEQDSGASRLSDLPFQPSPPSDQLYRFIHLRNPWLQEGPARRIADGIKLESESHKVDARLVAAVISVESSFNTRAVSPTGAKGLGQFISSTAKDMGITDPFDPDQGVRATARYVSWLLKSWQGHPRRLEMAIVSYSAGIGTLKKQQQNNQSFNEEQKQYLERVLKMYKAIDGKG
ncbi:MAG TPA: hypothetical protein DD435_09835 [Cyanobacteria bacterium UBA8530]|nr:hypothetical protein [Cyanobacteria bacterium UBA8530]